VPRPTSFRLPDELLARLDEEASSRGTSVSSLVSSVLDEGLKTRHFPGSCTATARPGDEQGSWAALTYGRSSVR